VHQAFDHLYRELLDMKRDLENRINHGSISEEVRRLAEEELTDVKITIEKWHRGCYGICEETGEMLPPELLAFQPLLRSINEARSMINYLKKPVYPIFD